MIIRKRVYQIELCEDGTDKVSGYMVFRGRINGLRAYQEAKATIKKKGYDAYAGKIVRID